MDGRVIYHVTLRRTTEVKVLFRWPSAVKGKRREHSSVCYSWSNAHLIYVNYITYIRGNY
jgi:hypothetical protein